VTPFYLLGWLLLGVAFVVTQTRFYDAHRRVHGWWRSRAEVGPTTLFYTPTEYRAMLRATFHAEQDAIVERARRRYLFVMALAVAYLVLALPAALLFGA
jgi:acyl-coenzyme A synthetase/AMP-(fatty) acid ligase